MASSVRHPARGLEGAGFCLDLVDEVAKLVGKFVLTAARSLCGDLLGNRIETSVVALGVAPDEGRHLVRGGHGHVVQ